MCSLRFSTLNQHTPQVSDRSSETPQTRSSLSCPAPIGLRSAGGTWCRAVTGFWLTYRTVIFVRLYEHISPLKRVKAIHIMILVWCASAFHSFFASVHRFNFASLHRFFCFSLLIPRVPRFFAILISFIEYMTEFCMLLGEFMICLYCMLMGAFYFFSIF